MERVKILTITLFAASLLFLPKMEAQQHLFPPPRPLCVSQFALANYACALLPYTPVPPPQPPSPPSPTPPDDDDEDDDEEGSEEHGHRHGHGHRHRHRHGHGHRHYEPMPAEDNCCRWLSQLDNECVCELLLHLPAFLLKPLHSYTLTVGEACTVNFTCGSPVRTRN